MHPLATGSPCMTGRSAMVPPGYLNRSTLSPGSQPMHSVYAQPGLPPQHLTPVPTVTHHIPAVTIPATIPATPILQLEEDPSPSERKCTNPGWLATFSVFLAIAIFISMQALSRGMPAKLGKGSNFKGLVCGADAPVKSNPFLYFPLDPSEDGSPGGYFGAPNLLKHDGRCVSKCPTEEDVTGKSVVAMTKRVTRQHPELGSSMVLEFEVATPAYASEPIANAYCLPLDRKLRAQAASILSSSSRQLSFAVASLVAAWPVVLSYSTLAVLIAILSTWLIRHLPVLTVHTSAISAVISLLVGGILAIRWGVRGAPQTALAVASGGTNHLTAIFRANYIWATVFGLWMIPVALFILAIWVKSPSYRLRAAKVLDMTAAVYSDMPNLILGPLIATAVSFLFQWFWVIVFLHLCGLSSIQARPEYISAGSGSNGSTSLLPLHQSSYFPFNGVASVVFWIVFLFWVIEIIKALTQFVTCYAGTIWYFASPEGGETKDMGWCPVLVALSLGLANHLGSFVFGAVMMGLTAPVRALGTWASVKNDYNSDDSVAFLSMILAPFKAFFSQIVDLLTTGGFVEMAISSADFWTAMQVSSRRLGLPGSPSARLSSQLNAVFRYLSVATSLTLSLCAYAVVTEPSSRYTSPTSPQFVASPTFIALVTFGFCWTYTSLFAAMWTALADSLLYAYLVESSSPSGEIDENPVEKLHAHAQIRDLVIETMDDFGY